MAYESIHVYLTDHFAGATAGLQVVDAAADRHRSDELGEFFSPLAAEIRQDKDTLKGLMTAMGVDESGAKLTLARLSTVFSAPKFSGRGIENDYLGDFTALEMLSIGVEGKLCMWKALEKVSGDYPALAELDITELRARATDQRSRIEAKRLEIAVQALTQPDAVMAA